MRTGLLEAAAANGQRGPGEPARHQHDAHAGQVDTVMATVVPQPLPDRFDRDLPVAAQLAHDRGQVGGRVVIQGAQHGRERQGPGRTLPIRPRPNRWRFGRDALESASSQPDCRPANPRGSEGYPRDREPPDGPSAAPAPPAGPGRSKRKVLTPGSPNELSLDPAFRRLQLVNRSIQSAVDAQARAVLGLAPRPGAARHQGSGTGTGCPL
jgi:hypothetical protein